MIRLTHIVASGLGVCFGIWLTVTAFGEIHNFVPEYLFKGSSLTGWHTLGQTGWRAENGEIVANPKEESGGWLILDKGYQDIQLNVGFKCSAGCRTGILLRAEKTPD